MSEVSKALNYLEIPADDKTVTVKINGIDVASFEAFYIAILRGNIPFQTPPQMVILDGLDLKILKRKAGYKSELLHEEHAALVAAIPRDLNQLLAIGLKSYIRAIVNAPTAKPGNWDPAPIAEELPAQAAG